MQIVPKLCYHTAQMIVPFVLVLVNIGIDIISFFAIIKQPTVSIADRNEMFKKRANSAFDSPVDPSQMLSTTESAVFLI